MARSRMIWVSSLLALFLSGFAPALAQDRGIDGRQAAQAPPPPPMNMDQLLLLWQGQSVKLKTLEVSIYRIDRDAAWDEEEHYQGHAAFKTPQLAFLDFSKVKLQTQPDPKNKDKKVVVPVTKDNQVESTPYERIVCTGQELWHYRYDVKQIYIYPLDKNQRKRAIEEGPLPFLFDMKAAEAKQRYEMALQGQDNTSYLVSIKPRLREDKDNFSSAVIYLDKDFLLPTRIYMLAPDGKSSRYFELSKIKANEPVKARLFTGVALGKPWKVERNPGGNAAPAPDVNQPR